MEELTKITIARSNPGAKTSAFSDPEFLCANALTDTPLAPLTRAEKAWVQNPNGSPPSQNAQSYLARKLKPYDAPLPDSQTAWQHYVLNKYVELIEDPMQDPKIVKGSLDSLAKTSTVNLFIERKEIEIKSKSTDQLEEELREMLNKYLGKPIDGEAVRVA